MCHTGDKNATLIAELHSTLAVNRHLANVNKAKLAISSREKQLRTSELSGFGFMISVYQ